jgi:predicted GNAT superfamily acetyltransferase
VFPVTDNSIQTTREPQVSADITIQAYYQTSDTLVERVWTLEKLIFPDPHSREKIARTFSSMPELVCLLALDGDTPCGFKAGYAMSERKFYSWIGGVAPEFRKRGIARKLMLTQHRILVERGYEVVRTHTENRFRNMLLLNIHSGFDIVGVISDVQQTRTTIVMDKLLTAL